MRYSCHMAATMGARARAKGGLGVWRAFGRSTLVQVVDQAGDLAPSPRGLPQPGAVENGARPSPSATMREALAGHRHGAELGGGEARR